ncbi:MAG: CoA transferase [Candidatus Cloacimonetes bacterium]|nr:CoA transferase [Candidatus Cloacimonadota bacterium]
MKNNSALNGLRVLELANVLAGPSVGTFLAELGAEVIKIENLLTRGDVTRKWKLPTEDPETDISGYFSCVNWGKLSIALDLKQDAGLGIVLDLVKISDIVLVSYKPGDARKLGVDYPALRKVREDIIYGEITGYGPANPRAGYDALLQAETGFTYMNGTPDGPPVKMPVALIDVMAAHQLKEAILLALLEKTRTGAGKYLQVSLFQSGIASLVNQAANWLVGKTNPERLGSDHPNIVPYGTIFSTRTGEIVLAVGTDRQFEDLCRVLGVPEWAQDDRFSSNYQRVRHRDVLKEMIAGEFSKWARDELLNSLNEWNIPSGAVHNLQEVFRQPEAQDLLLSAELTSGKYLQGVRSVVFMKSSDILPPPHLGEHTDYILTRLLNYSQDKIACLTNKNIIS